MFAVLRFPWNDWVEEKKPAWARPLTKVVLGFLGAKSRRCQVSGVFGRGGVLPGSGKCEVTTTSRMTLWGLSRF